MAIVGDMISRVLALPVNGIVTGLNKIGGFYTIDELVFGDAGAISSSEWTKIILPWWNWGKAVSAAMYISTFVILAIGFKTLSGAFSGNSTRTAENQERLLGIITAAAIVATAPWLLRSLFALNSMIVESVKGFLATQGITITGFNRTDILGAIDSGNPLLDALINLAFMGLMFHFNLMYMVRRFVIIVLFAVTPIVAWSWAFKKTRFPMMLLLSEVVSNSLMSATHAITLGFYLTLVNSDPSGLMGRWWAKLFALTMVIPTAALLRRMMAGWFNLFGLDEEKYAGLATAGFSGLTGLATLGAAATGKTANAIVSGGMGLKQFLHDRGGNSAIQSGSSKDDSGGSGGGSRPISSAINSHNISLPPGTASPGQTSPASPGGVQNIKAGSAGAASNAVASASKTGAALTSTKPTMAAGTGSHGPAETPPTSPTNQQEPKRSYKWVADAADDALGTIGTFAGAVMGIATKDANTHNAYGDFVRGALTSPISVGRKVSDLRRHSSQASLDGPRWN
jgi:hypothetical protein